MTGRITRCERSVQHCPAGQIWIDLEKRAAERVGVVGHSRDSIPAGTLGTRLLAWGERVLEDSGFAIAELEVEKANLKTRRFYERLGYRCIGESAGSYSFTTPDGVVGRQPLDDWVLQKSLARAT